MAIRTLSLDFFVGKADVICASIEPKDKCPGKLKEIDGFNPVLITECTHALIFWEWNFDRPTALTRIIRQVIRKTMRQIWEKARVDLL